VRFWRDIGRFAFLNLPLGDLGATYDDHIRLIGKRVEDFLLMLVERFSLGRTAEALRAIIGSKSAISLQRGPVDPKFQVEGVAPPTNHSSSRKTTLTFCFSRGIKIWTDFSSVLSQSTRLTDGQTDRILIARPRIHSMQRGNNHYLSLFRFFALLLYNIIYVIFESIFYYSDLDSSCHPSRYRPIMLSLITSCSK